LNVEILERAVKRCVRFVFIYKLTECV